MLKKTIKLCSRSWQVVKDFCASSSLGIINKRWHFHAKRSGISPVAENLGKVVPYSLINPPADLYEKDADPESLQQALDACASRIRKYCKLMRIKHVIFLFADLEMPLIAALRKQSELKISGVFHLPTGLVKDIASQYNSILDGIICVSSDLPAAVAAIGKNADCIAYIPHGVDCDYFYPPEINTRQKLLLCVGDHYRDFKVLNAMAELLAQQAPEYCLTYIGHQPDKISPPLSSRIQVLSGISDAALRELYQQAMVVLLPLTAATANNSLLEAIACATPVVITDLPATHDYLNNQCARFARQGDAADHVALTLQLLEAPDTWATASQAARSKALEFDWPVIQRAYREFCQQV